MKRDFYWIYSQLNNWIFCPVCGQDLNQAEFSLAINGKTEVWNCPNCLNSSSWDLEVGSSPQVIGITPPEEM